MSLCGSREPGSTWRTCGKAAEHTDDHGDTGSYSHSWPQRMFLVQDRSSNGAVFTRFAPENEIKQRKLTSVRL